MVAIPELGSETELDAALRAPLVFVYKHSPICGQSDRAEREVQRFRDGHPEVEVLLVDVIGSRPLSRRIAERTGVEHESPQILLFREGTVVAHASHRGVTSPAMEAMVRAARGIHGEAV